MSVKQQGRIFVFLPILLLALSASVAAGATWCSSVYNFQSPPGVWHSRKWCYTFQEPWLARFATDPLGLVPDFFWVIFYYVQDGIAYPANVDDYDHLVDIVLGNSDDPFCDCQFGMTDEFAILAKKTILGVENSGVADLHLSAGCSDLGLIGTDPRFELWDDELNHYFYIRSPWITASTDAVDDHGKRASQFGWDPQGVCKVSLSDAVYHTENVKGGDLDACSDLNGWNNTDVADASRMTPAIVDGGTCTRGN